MNMKFKVKNLSVQVTEEVDVKIEEVEVSYEDFKLSEIPAIIREAGTLLKQTMDSASSMATATRGLNVDTLFGINQAGVDTDGDTFGSNMNSGLEDLDLELDEDDFTVGQDRCDDEDDSEVDSYDEDEEIEEDVRGVVSQAKPAVKRSTAVGKGRVRQSIPKNRATQANEDDEF